MIVSRILLLLLLICGDSISQENNMKYILLEENHPKYVYYINGIIYKCPEILEDTSISITSIEDYNDDEEIKIIGEPSFTPGLSFTICRSEILTSEQIKNLNFVNYEWLEENRRIKTGNRIEMNKFENLSIVLKKKDQYILYGVQRKFSSTN